MLWPELIICNKGLNLYLYNSKNNQYELEKNRIALINNN